MRSIICIGFVIWSLVPEANATNKALILNFEKLSLIHLPADRSNLICRQLMTLCPAGNEQEGVFNDEYSTYDRALFYQRIYFYQQSCERVLTNVCDDPYKISMILLPNGKIYEFGYEVYYYNRESISDLPPIKYYPMKRFRWQPTLEANRAEINKVIKERSETEFYLQGHYVERKTQNGEEQVYLPGGIMSYLWIPLVRVELHLENFRNVEYEIRENNINPRLECKDDSLGKEIIKPSLVNALYTTETQKQIFDGVKLPTRNSETNEYPEGACSPENNCLIKWPLLPTDQYQFDSDSPLICSNITTIPIWRSTLEGIMDKLDKYLYALHRLSGQALRIHAGVHKILSLPQQQIFTFKKKIKLQKYGAEIETPKLIYKMVKFKLDPCETNQNCWYGVLIVIHNGPYRSAVEKDSLCKDQSGILGWGEIRYETRSDYGAQSQFIYVCEISKSTIRGVGLPYNKDITFEPLSLLNFPVFNKNKKLEFKPLKGELFDEMKRLSDPDEKVKLKDGVIERPFLNYNFGFKSEDKGFLRRIRKT